MSLMVQFAQDRYLVEQFEPRVLQFMFATELQLYSSFHQPPHAPAFRWALAGILQLTSPIVPKVKHVMHYT